MASTGIGRPPNLNFSTRARSVAELLRRMILTGELPPGTHLRQNDFAERFGVSVTPIREAFAALAREGFLDQDDHRGVVVFSPSAEDLRENYEIRISLESLATELAAARITEPEIAALEARQGELRAALKDDLARYGTELSLQFHLQLYAAAHRPRLLALITQLREAAVSYTHLLALNPPRSTDILEAAQRDKEEICQALRAGDSERAVTTVRRHLQRSAEIVLSALEHMPATERPNDAAPQRRDDAVSS